MKFDCLLTGVGGEGVLTAGVMVAKAAHLEGHFVRGVQLHGLAQRGGSIPTYVRFGSERELSSPGIMQANADLVIAFEPLEAVRAAFYARKEKTDFVINDDPYMPVYANLLDMPYPKMAEIFRRVKPFARKVLVFNTHELAKEEFGRAIYGNTMLIGAAAGAGLIPLKKSSLLKSIKIIRPRDIKNNVAAFGQGVKLGKRE